jgi:hypothetical protein
MKQLFIFSFIILCKISFAQNVGINTTSPNAALDVYGELALKSASLTTPDGTNYALNINSNKFSNYKLTGPTADFVIAGITAGVDGVLVTLHNRSGFTMELYDEDLTATNVNRIHTGSAITLAIYNNGSVTLQYDSDLQRWTVLNAHYYNINFFGGTGGGTGVGWSESGTNIFNSNTGNVGIGLMNPSRAKLELNGAADDAITTAIFGGDGWGLGFARNWPSIGYNLYWDAAGNNRAIKNGYSAHTFSNPVGGGWALVVHDSVGTNAPFVQNYFSLLVNKKGNVGIKTTSDDATLSIAGDDNYPSHFNYGVLGHTYIRGGDREYRDFGAIQFRPSKVYINDVPGINYLTGTQQPGGDVILATGGGSVGIGTENTAGYRLAVNGNIRAKELRINTGWADYVFEDNYQLMPLAEVEKYIKKNKHLPEIPEASLLQKEGVDVSTMQTKMMAKIEELTLHLIEANKRIAALEKKKN